MMGRTRCQAGASCSGDRRGVGGSRAGTRHLGADNTSCVQALQGNKLHLCVTARKEATRVAPLSTQEAAPLLGRMAGLPRGPDVEGAVPCTWDSGAEIQPLSV